MTSIPYNLVLTQDIPAYPPYYIGGVAMQGFYLKADPQQLQYLVDSYLNIVPSQVAYFRPAAPYVLLLVQFQGESGQAAASGGMQYGFVAETIVSFVVPLIRYRLVGQKLVFDGFSSFMPFVYSSDQSSVSFMASIFGWTNVLGYAEPRISNRVYKPTAPNLILSLKTGTIPTLWQGDRPDLRRLLHVEQASPSDFSLWPPLSNGCFGRRLSGILQGASEAVRDLAALLAWWWSTGLLRCSGDVLRGALENLVNSIKFPAAPFPAGTLVTLKQFRDAEKQDKAAYQALLDTPIGVCNIAEMKLLGLPFLMEGDLSGGYSVRINVYGNHPVVGLLGLRPDYWEAGRVGQRVASSYLSQAGRGWSNLAELPKPSPPYSLESSLPSSCVLKPIFPFSVLGNFFVGGSRTYCWRLRDSPWYVNAGRQKVSRSFGGAFMLGRPEPGGNPYNTALGASITQYTAPFMSADVTTRILPLRASRKKLQELVDQYLNVLPDHHFTVDWSYLLVIISNYGQMASDQENLGSWVGNEIEFSLPLTWVYKGNIVAKGLFAPYIFSDSDLGVLTKSLVLGFNIAKAHLASPADVWLDEAKPESGQPLLHLWAYTYPSLRLGTYPEKTVLLEIIRNYAERDPGATGVSREESELKRLFSEFVRLHDTLYYINLKQFPAAQDGDEACYQAVVCASRKIIKKRFLKESDTPLHVRIQHTPIYPIVDMLGLSRVDRSVGIPPDPFRVWQGCRYDVIEVDRTVWFKGDHYWGKALNLAWRAIGASEWHMSTGLERYLEHTRDVT